MDRRPLATSCDLRFWASMLLCCALVTGGCSDTKWVTVRDTPHNPLAERLMLLSSGGPKPTTRTVMFLRRYDLAGQWHANPQKLVHSVQDVLAREPSAEGLHAAAELSYLGGVRSQAVGKSQQALDLYGSSVTYSYAYLFEPQNREICNPYDPQFRGSCDLYNAALEALVRSINKQGKLRPGETVSLEANGQTWDVTVTPRNTPWPAEDIERFEFVSDYSVDGLKNVFHTYGLGVPLIAVRKSGAVADPIEKHYPPGLCFPVTAFLRCDQEQAAGGVRQAAYNGQQAAGSGAHHHAVLELYNPLEATDIVVDDRRVPLESDITTPLAYTLDNPAFAALDQPTTGLLNPGHVKKLAGIYMLEPFQPGKIPVLMVHGLWSSPITWMEMFNDLRGDPELERNYQFWFYLYPTGQPFWRAATQLREALAELRRQVDPEHREPALDQMVLVGHSMGGLISHMQVVNSRDDFWNLVSDKPLAEVKADENTHHDLDRTFYFQANNSVRRIVTIGTPHRGSHFANDVTEYLSEKLISFPERMTARFTMLRLQNPGFFRDTQMLDTETSIDSLSPTCPVLPALLAAQQPPWIRYDNVVGRLPAGDWQARLFGDGDGVVPYKSAHLAGADSEIEVPAEHSEVHRHPQTILQVRMLLEQHLREAMAYPEVVRR